MTWRKSTCKSCRVPVIWAITEDGKRMPVDAEPVEHGNVMLSGPGQRPLATVVSPGQAAAAAAKGVALRLSHFATCPKGDVHRQRVERSRRLQEQRALAERTGQTDLFATPTPERHREDSGELLTAEQQDIEDNAPGPGDRT